MALKIESIQKELESLVVKGEHLLLAMISDCQELPDDVKEELKKKEITIPKFEDEYNIWYSEALAVIKQLLPDREADFVMQYKDEKRKEVNHITYGIADYLLGLRTSIGDRVIADRPSAIAKMRIQCSIVLSAQKRFESSLLI